MPEWMNEEEMITSLVMLKLKYMPSSMQLLYVALLPC